MGPTRVAMRSTRHDQVSQILHFGLNLRSLTIQMLTVMLSDGPEVRSFWYNCDIWTRIIMLNVGPRLGDGWAWLYLWIVRCACIVQYPVCISMDLGCRLPSEAPNKITHRRHLGFCDHIGSNCIVACMWMAITDLGQYLYTLLNV